MKFTISFAAISALALAVSAAPMPFSDPKQVNAAVVAPVPVTVQGKTTTTTTAPGAQLNANNKDGLVKRIGTTVKDNQGNIAIVAAAATYLGSAAYQMDNKLTLKQAAVHPFATEKTRERLFKEAELKARLKDVALLRKLYTLEQGPEEIIPQILNLQNDLGQGHFPALAQIWENCNDFQKLYTIIAAQLEKASDAASIYEQRVDPSVRQDQKVSDEDFEKSKKDLAESLTILLEARDIAVPRSDSEDFGDNGFVEYVIKHHDTLNGKAVTPKSLRSIYKKYDAEQKKAEAKAKKTAEQQKAAAARAAKEAAQAAKKAANGN